MFDPVALTWTWQHYVSVSPRFAAVINNLLSYKPSDRYQSASDVLQMLEPINLSQPSIVQPPPPSVTQQNTIALVGRRRQSTIRSH
ncbi:MAG: hypothetical protein HC936_04250 [Leptolyngbyaceae cyanobacterium SU_3_3]|nr:hypothetical protein [Leptolyngbyaceae cyanobacterium SU_3_3]